MANTREKSLPQEGERRLVESLRAARLRLFDTPTADILRRLFGERRFVNGAPQRRDETTGRDFESDGGCPTGQEAELGRAGRKPSLLRGVREVGGGYGRRQQFVEEVLQE